MFAIEKFNKLNEYGPIKIQYFQNKEKITPTGKNELDQF